MKQIIILILCSLILSCNEVDNTNEDLGYMFDKICIEGHIYYRMGRQLAIKLDSNGKPIKCGEVRKQELSEVYIMDIEEIIKLFKQYKFKVEYMGIEDEIAYLIETDEIRIGIFDHTYPNTGYCGKILMEHQDNFDKWSKAFYSSSFPTDKDDFLIILEDIKYVSTDFNKIAGNKFGSLTRDF